MPLHKMSRPTKRRSATLCYWIPLILNSLSSSCLIWVSWILRRQSFVLSQTSPLTILPLVCVFASFYMFSVLHDSSWSCLVGLSCVDGCWSHCYPRQCLVPSIFLIPLQPFSLMNAFREAPFSPGLIERYVSPFVSFLFCFFRFELPACMMSSIAMSPL